MVKPIVLNPNENVGISEHWVSSHTKGRVSRLAVMVKDSLSASY